MTIYPDPSLLLSAFLAEADGTIAAAFLADIPEGSLLTSSWTITAITSALGVRSRTGSLRPSQRSALFHEIVAALAASATEIVPIASDFARASDLMLATELPLRAGDALHLAIASRAGATLWTLDRRMVAAGQALGLDARLLA